MKFFFKYFCIVIIILISTGLVYQTSSQYIDNSAFIKTGKMIEVGGYSLYTEESGTGRVNVIFDSGMGDDLSVWKKVSDEVSKFARVITYDRAGLGWSDESPKERTSEEIVHELHSMLDKKKFTGPIILVGHSFGGVNMQQYALKYPDDIAGLVLIDSAHESQIDEMPEPSFIQKYLFKFGMWAAPVGLPRLYLSNSNPEEKAKKSTTKHQYTSLDEAQSFHQSLNQLQALKPNFGNLPLVVIARNKPSSEQPASDTRNYVWAELQENIATRSSNSTIIFTRERQHSIHKSQPDIVVTAIRSLVDNLY
ncbi:alpha/beta hydrolase [Salinimonas iocasae]|uniref:Alpha/beta hydrolase n=1 Tax=Salinimonas iocasae TaxID=2572577 RepID=A0A5B7YBY1_9ALTE|nr:alpha/beta hydrolase [Salinimonas iocasae]QCZ92139.1 alpha/beta hydrolase [Salinimonas iocasae]